eukprot:scaffold15650_cov58-Phaeocystis_antarctica.AAC.2
MLRPERRRAVVTSARGRPERHLGAATPGQGASWAVLPTIRACFRHGVARVAPLVAGAHGERAGLAQVAARQAATKRLALLWIATGGAHHHLDGRLPGGDR